MPGELPSFDIDDRTLDPCDGRQVQAWAEFYQATPDLIRTCDAVGPSRTVVELTPAAPAPKIAKVGAGLLPGPDHKNRPWSSVFLTPI